LEFRYRIVDVFSDRPLAGNALCVVVDPVPEPVMQAIAREVNLSETTFPVVTGDDSYDVRIFTPDVELPFAGHPSLGTAWVLGPNRWTQTSEGTTVEVEADGDGATMTQPDPTFVEVDAEAAGAAIGVEPAGGAYVAEAAGLRHLLVPTLDLIDRVAPDAGAVAALARRHRCPTVGVVRPLAADELHVRVFAPGAGIAEDPGTGSTAGPVAVLARRLWDVAADVTIWQGAEVGRPCRIEVHAVDGDLRVGGRVAPCAEGRFTL
jgi:trans-2,3-dihydro-3-hydroxyanthranilate isomerase